MRRSFTVSAVAATIIGLGTTPALAHDGNGDEDRHGRGGFVPVEEIVPDYYAPVTFDACGDTITMETGDVRQVVARQTVSADSVFTEFRGGWTVDLVRHSDHARIDELDISGAGSDETRPDGISIYLEGPSILFPMDDLQRQAMRDAGIETDLAYYERGVVEIEVALDAAGVPVSEEWTRVDARIRDLCTQFDRDDDHRDDRHHRDHARTHHEGKTHHRG
ncbi:hypothetical protein GCU56_17990 [Geodermatophilus sabuli]|uniref:Uncharacterized protein n=1 Tax=Geodermatophilus sabuli TaxID=1564158 RepID=A0A7K3W4D3_9ACTN|nr:hypothetical protein [Geodermatophilus sabuli]NEK59749.1 hypothetical protein [Geodermatophilus sabuli]